MLFLFMKLTEPKAHIRWQILGEDFIILSIGKWEELLIFAHDSMTASTDSCILEQQREAEWNRGNILIWYVELSIITLLCFNITGH
jgi:hypothetical protein